MLEEYRGKKRMGWFLANFFDEQSLLSINHFYEKGEMKNNIGKGLELREVYVPSVFSKTVDFSNYLYFFSDSEYFYSETKKRYYDAVFFTSKISAAKMVNGE